MKDELSLIFVAIFLVGGLVGALKVPSTTGESSQAQADTTQKRGIHQKAPGQNWTPPAESAIKRALTKRQYEVTREDDTEPAFNNLYWDHKQEGIYVDIVSGEALFSSTHKFESGTGWPSFTQPIDSANVTTQPDRGFFGTRTEVRSKRADSHLGHVFNDGPAPTGKRWCMNSAALRFVPKDELQAQGYGEYLHLFQE